MSAPVVEARGVSRILPGASPVTLVADIDLRIEAGEFTAITGPSGSGKSSLLYLLGLLDAPTAGEVLIEGRPTSVMDEEARARLRLSRIGFVFQFHFLLPEFDALDNVALPIRRLGRLRGAAAEARARALLEGFGMGPHLRKRPDQLSGGQRQRVAVARAIANDPALVLADEPTGSLDSAASEQVFEVLRGVASQPGRSVVVVTHDHDMAARMDRRVHLVDGRIESDARRPSAPARPADAAREAEPKISQ